ncbi:MAG: hypothetical protein CBB94_06035 [Gammaproteobacteria bacterium TMED34]|nr:MAG: hypothetical protein CBB94_06035 [Gammaproteobacteria bacterium TMED34]
MVVPLEGERQGQCFTHTSIGEPGYLGIEDKRSPDPDPNAIVSTDLSDPALVHRVTLVGGGPEADIVLFDHINHTLLSGLTVPADRDRAIPEVSGDSLEIYLDVESGEARYFGVKVGVASKNAANVEETVIGYDASAGVIRLDARRSGSVEKSENVDAGPLRLRPGESLKLRVFIDKSVVEVFANQRQAVARIIYPSKGSVGVSLFAEGGNAKVHSLNAWQLSPSNPY